MFKFCPQCKSEQIKTTNIPLIECPDCQFTYFHNCASAVAGIIYCHGDILFNIRAKEPAMGCYDLPGGFVDYDESLEHALTREVKEELDIEINQWKYFCSQANTYQYKDVTYKTTDAIFIAQLSEKPTVSLELEEVSDIAWVALEDIDLNKIGFTSLQEAVRLFLVKQQKH